MSEVLISVENLRTSFLTKRGEARAVDNVSYSVHKGEVLGIVGESGCGKSVTSLSIMRLLQPPGRITGGKIQFKNQDLVKLSEKQMEDVRGRQIAMIFQEPMTALNPVQTIGHQISEQIRRHMKVGKKEAKDRSIELLKIVGIPSPAARFDNYPHQLSGGMRQRGMIAMALSCQPEFLIADEPTTALDVTVQAQILELLQSLQEKFNMTVQFITHDLGVISDLADRVMVMYAGRTCEIAPTEELFSNPRHPYTAALISSVPKPGARVKRLPTIDGSVPSLLELPRGCPFQNRCNRVTDACRETMPAIQSTGAQHLVACHNPVGGAL